MAPKPKNTLSVKDKKKSGGSGTSFILMIGDEGAILVQMQRKRVIRRLFAQAPDPSYTSVFENALASSPHAPITMLIDMMDQSYVHQTLPPVSSFNVSKIVKRRMDKDFSPDDIKGYLILDRAKTGRKDWNYLMVSLANPPLLQKWIAFAVERPNPFKGIGLIPLEAQRFLLATSKKLLKDGKNSKSLEWQILVSHHKVGGFRQIVLRNGKLVFTRMAQPIGESLPGVIAGNIEQEIINTLEYLKRMGLQDPTSLSVVIVASGEIKQAMDPGKIKAGEYRFFTPYEIANLLSVTDAAQPEDHFCDVVIAAFIIKQSKLLLPMQTPYTQKLRYFSWAILGARLVAVIAMLAILTQTGMTVADILATKQATETLETHQAQLKNNLASIKTKALSLPKQIDTITDVVGMVKLFNKRRLDALTFINNVSGTFQNAALSTSYHWTLSDPMSVTKDTDKRQLSAEITLRLITPPEPKNEYIAAAQSLMNRIKKTLPEFDVTHTELPELLSNTQVLKTVINDKGIMPTANSATSTQIDSVTVTVKGPLSEQALQALKKWPLKV